MSRSGPSGGSSATARSNASRAEESRSSAQRSEHDLRAELDLLRAETRRLQSTLESERRATYRRVAIGLTVVALVALGGAVLVPDLGRLFLAVSAMGVGGAILTYSLSRDRVVATAVGERVFAAAADNAAGLVDELGLTSTRVYVPTDGPVPARLFIPQSDEYELPSSDALESVLVVDVDDASRGLSLVPTGARLFTEFQRTLGDPLGDAPAPALRRLNDALVEEFELAAGTDANVNPSEGRATTRVDGNVYGPASRVDHPVASFLAVGLAVALDQPVRLEAGTYQESLLVTCRWGPALEPGGDETAQTTPEGKPPADASARELAMGPGSDASAGTAEAAADAMSEFLQDRDTDTE